ncbi:MAG TPA: hypothetical protein PK453_22195 [Leptospiraceae bacterium]|nr:hypothetical protein [Leptospiraceae bacterium]HNF16389.1 hypothetical protein [Leptospiraceae bacterium]HNF27055.1 hypothetical protein [Leptospiraceae bacterium]HNM04612.1 hypothetical protein [Leptospiraceae bacterium]HNN05032.1 hypothetical protein [Leptospiraceae bacterium]
MRKIIHNHLLLVLLAILTIFHITLRTDNSFTSDALLKAIQTDSFVSNGFKSFSLHPGSEKIDSTFETFFFSGSFAVQTKTGLFSVFPDMLAAIASVLVLLRIPYMYFPFIFSVPFAFAVFFLFKKKLISAENGIIMLVLTVLFPLISEFSENALFFLINTFGFYFWIKFRENDSLKFLFFSVFTVSLTVWLRLEAILFLISLAAGEFFSGRKKIEIPWLRKFLPFFLAGTIPLLLLLIWNSHYYGHPFGLRYIYNYIENKVTAGDRTVNLLSTVFFFYDNGIPKIGILLHSVFLLIPILFFLKKKEGTQEIKFLLWTSFLFLLSVGLSAPNNGVTVNGRYHILALLPLFRLYQLWDDETAGKKRKAVLIGCLAVSSLISFTAVLVLKYAFNVQKDIRVFHKSVKSDLHVFTNSFLCNAAGLDHLEMTVICLKKGLDLKKIADNIVRNPEIKTVSFLNYDENKNKPFIKSEMALSAEKDEEFFQILKSRFKNEDPVRKEKGLLLRKISE